MAMDVLGYAAQSAKDGLSLHRFARRDPCVDYVIEILYYRSMIAVLRFIDRDNHPSGVLCGLARCDECHHDHKRIL